MDVILHLGIVIASSIILYFAYFTKNKLATLISFVILAAILLAEFLGILAGIQFIDFLRDAFNSIKGLIIYVQIGLIIFLSFFKFKETKSSILGITIIVLVVLLLIVELQIF